MKKTRQFTLADFINATNIFSEEIGDQGSFGHRVYKGSLDEDRNHLSVAVKWVPPRPAIGTEEFVNAVNLLSRVHHKNLVRFVGYSCFDANEKILVYELMPKGSLYHALHSGMTRGLTLGQRLTIMRNAAQGLRYLHYNGVTHGDVSSRNILLSEDLQGSKLAGFGLNNLAGINADPEREPPTNLSPKERDIYGFGIVLLEVICGKPAQGVVDWVERGGARVADIIDQRLEAGSYDTESMQDMVELALNCVQYAGRRAPTMTKVITALDPARVRRITNAGSRVNKFDDKGSLHDALHIAAGSMALQLTWRQRLQIVLDAALELRGLHNQDAIHGDVSSKNILLSDKLKGKLVDRGLNNAASSSDAERTASRPPANLSPKERDIYGFGIVLFEIICGQPADGVVAWVERGEARVVDIMDKRLEFESSYDKQSMQKMVEVALKCVQFGGRAAPTMTTVYNEISRARNPRSCWC